MRTWTRQKHPICFPEFDDDDRAPFYSILMINLVEMLINLQIVEGFDVCLKQLRLPQLQSGLSELQTGMILYQCGLPFRYVDPAAVPGRTYDIEFQRPDGVFGFAEVKCQYDETQWSEKTLRNILSRGRKQIPSGGPGVLFVKLPQSFLEEGEERHFHLRAEIVPTAKDFLRGTSRVVKIIFCVFKVTFRPTRTHVDHAQFDVSNIDRNTADPSWNEPLLVERPALPWVRIQALGRRWAPDADPKDW
jgi:hypothetical protein